MLSRIPVGLPLRLWSGTFTCSLGSAERWRYGGICKTTDFSTTATFEVQKLYYMHCTGWRLLQHLPKLLPIDLHLTTGLLFYSLFHKTCQPLKQNFKPDITCWLVSRSSLNMMLQVLRTVEPKLISVKILFCNKVSSGHHHPHNS